MARCVDWVLCIGDVGLMAGLLYYINKRTKMCTQLGCVSP